MTRDAIAGLVGAVFGLVFGLVFVLVNAGPLPAPYDVLVRVLGVVLFVGVVVLLVRRGPPLVEVSERAVRIYWTSVLLEAVLLVGGAALLSRTGHGDLSLPWVVVVVGLHSIPFATAFRLPFYLWLAGVLGLLGLCGGALALAGASVAWVSLVSGVGAGLTLLGFAALPAARQDAHA